LKSPLTTSSPKDDAGNGNEGLKSAVAVAGVDAHLAGERDGGDVVESVAGKVARATPSTKFPPK